MSIAHSAPDVRIPITAAATRCGVTLRAVRYYEQQGLLQTLRDKSGGRRFDRASLSRLAYIASARQAGLSIREIAELLEVRRREGDAAAAERMRAMCKAQLNSLAKRQRHLQDMISVLSNPPAQAGAD